MRVEWKKIWKKQYGIWILFFGFLLKIVVLYYQGESIYIENLIQTQKEAYTEYIRQVGGKLTEKTITWMETEKERIEQSLEKREQAWDWYSKKEINLQEFTDIIGKSEKDQDNKAVFDLLYQTMEREREKENGYLLNPNGWITLLGQEHLDWILPILMILLISPIFSIEYESEMHLILKTSKYGRTRLFIEKLLVMIGTGIVVTTVDCGIEFIFVQWRDGLSCLEAPIQSIRVFQDSPYNITLIETFLLQSLMKLYGCLYLSVILVFLSIICKATTTVLFAGSMITLLPYFLLEKIQLYQLPFPTGFFIPAGFYAGIDMQQKNLVTVEPKKFIIMMIITTVILSILLLLAYNWYKKEIWEKKRWIAIISIGVTCFVILALYKNFKQEWIPDNEIAYDSFTRGIIEENETWRFEIVEGRIKVQEKRSPEESYWLDELLMEPQSTISWMQLLENKLYYLQIITGRENRIVELDLSSFETKTIYCERDSREGNPYFLNIHSERNSSGKIFQNIDKFVIDSGRLIFMSDNLYCIDSQTGEKKQIDFIYLKQFVVQDGYVYYMNRRMQLCAYSIQTDTVKTVMDDPCLDFKVEDEMIYYCREDGNWYPLE